MFSVSKARVSGIKAGTSKVPDVLRGSAGTGNLIPPIRSAFPSPRIDRTIELMDEPIMSQSLLTASTCERNSLFYQEGRTLSNRQHLKVDFYADFLLPLPPQGAPLGAAFLSPHSVTFYWPATASDA